MARAVAALGLAALVMLPRLASPQFGLLDDGHTLQTARQVHGQWTSVLYLIPETGRFFPAHWLAYSLISSLVGVRPLAFFTITLFVFAVLIAMLARLVRLLGGTPVAAAIGAIFFASSGPAIETFYTLSKAEPLQALWIGASLLGTAASARTADWSLKRGAWLALAMAAALLAHTTKETSIVLIPIGIGWLAFEWRARPRESPRIRFAASYVAVSVVAASVFLVLRWQYAALGIAEGTYTRAYVLQPATIGPALFRIAAWLVRDFAWLLPVLAAAWLLGNGGGIATRRQIAYPGIWMAGWLLVFLPWPATFEYYLFPFTCGAAALAGAVVGEAWARRHRERLSPTPRLAWAFLVTTGLLWSVSLVNASLDARVQLTVDRANADMVRFLATLPRDSHVVFNMTPVNEYHFEVPMHLSEIMGRRDLVFLQPKAPRESGALSGPETYVLTPEMVNQPGPTVRIALHEAGVRQDNGRLLGTLVPGGTELVYRTAQRSHLIEIGLQRLLCLPGRGLIDEPAYCPSDRGVLFRRTFAYGWQVHRVVQRAPNAPR
jgi:hypothetical protein